MLFRSQTLLWQTVIHLAFLLSALAIAMTDRLLSHPPADKH